MAVAWATGGGGGSAGPGRSAVVAKAVTRGRVSVGGAMAAVWAADGGGGPAGPDRFAALVEAAAGGVGVLATCVTAVDDRACRAIIPAR